jgi:hypothetical protein
VRAKTSAAVSQSESLAVAESRKAEGLTAHGEACNRAVQKHLDDLFRTALTTPQTQEHVRLAVFDVVRKTELHRKACPLQNCQSEWSFIRRGLFQLAVGIATEAASQLEPSPCARRLADHCTPLARNGMSRLRTQLRRVLKASLDEVACPCDASGQSPDPAATAEALAEDSRAIACICAEVNRMSGDGRIAQETQHTAHALLADDDVAMRLLETEDAHPEVAAAVLVSAISQTSAPVLSAVARARGCVEDACFTRVRQLRAYFRTHGLVTWECVEVTM